MCWTWDPIPRDASDPRTASWGDGWRDVGAANVWAPMSVDEVRGHGADRDQVGRGAWREQLLAQHGGDVALGHQPGLEVQSGGEVEVAVAGPRVAVDAAVFAAPVRVDRPVEGQVGRVHRVKPAR